MPNTTRARALPPAMILLVAGAAALGLAPRPIASTPRLAADGQRAHYLPHTVSAGYTTSLAAARVPAPAFRPAAALHGMVGFGESTVELQNLGAADLAVRLDLRTAVGFSDVAAVTQMAAGGSGALELRRQRGITHANYAAVVTAGGPLAALARAGWQGGAQAVYEAPEPATALVLPLVARDVYSHTSVIWLQNATDVDDNEVEVALFREDGALASSWTFVVPGRRSGQLDLTYSTEFSGLPVNAATGFLGAFHIAAESPLAVMAYGDEPQGRGVAALAARPRAAAADRQYLPFVRASSAGHALIALANLGGSPAAVTITYLGAASSPGSSGQVFAQQFVVGPRAQAYVDLDPRLRRGNRDTPALPPAGFVGSAVIEADAPVLAAVLDQSLGAGIDPANGLPPVLGSFAYNAYGPDDLRRSYAVPRARVGLTEHTTYLAIQNPGTETAVVTLELRDAGGRPASPADTLLVPPGGAMLWARPPAAAPGTYQLVSGASAPVAIVALDTAAAADWTAFWPVPLDASVIVPPTAVATPSATRVAATPTAAPIHPLGTVFLPIGTSPRR